MATAPVINLSSKSTADWTAVPMGQSNVTDAADFLNLIGDLLKDITADAVQDLSTATGKPTVPQTVDPTVAGKSTSATGSSAKESPLAKEPKEKQQCESDPGADASGAGVINLVVEAPKPMLLNLNFDPSIQASSTPDTAHLTPIKVIPQSASPASIPSTPEAHSQQDPATQTGESNLAFRVMIQPPDGVATTASNTVAEDIAPPAPPEIGSDVPGQSPRVSVAVATHKPEPGTSQDSERHAPTTNVKQFEHELPQARQPETTQPTQKTDRSQQFSSDKTPADHRPDTDSDVPNVANQSVPALLGHSGETLQPAHSTEAKAPPGPYQAPAAVSAPQAARLEPEPANAPPSTPLREIAVRVQSETGGPNVDVHVVDRSGNLTVDVRTADTDLTQTLRSNVGQLVTRLEESGFKSQTSMPVSAISQLSSSGQVSQQNSSGSGSDANRDGSQHYQSNQEQHHHHQPGRRAREAWEQYFDNTLNDEMKARKF